MSKWENVLLKVIKRNYYIEKHRYKLCTSRDFSLHFHFKTVYLNAFVLIKFRSELFKQNR